MTSNDIKACVSADIFEKFEKFSLNQRLAKNDKIVWCPNAGCKWYFEHKNEADFTCP